MNHSRGLRAALVALAAVGLLAGCGGTAQAAPAPTATPVAGPVGPPGDGVLRLGALVPLTGDHGNEGAAQLAGVELAVREINEAGGVLGAPVQVFARDSGDATTELAETSFGELAERGADVIIGPSDPALAGRLLPLAASSGVALVSPTLVDADVPGGDPLGWLTGVSRAFVDPGSAEKPTDAFLARLLASDPGLDVVRTGPEAYDATILAALAAVAAGDDGGASVAGALTRVTAGPLRCASYGECVAVLAAGADPAYSRVTGSIDAGRG